MGDFERRVRQRTDGLRQEIYDLQTKVQEAEQRTSAAKAELSEAATARRMLENSRDDIEKKAQKDYQARLEQERRIALLEGRESELRSCEDKELEELFLVLHN